MLSTQNLNWRVLAKAERIIRSCKTKEQLEVAEKFFKLALKQSPSDSYKIIIDSADQYYWIQKQISEVLENCKRNI